MKLNKDFSEVVCEIKRRSSSTPSESLVEKDMKKFFGSTSEGEEITNDTFESNRKASRKSLLVNHWRQDTYDTDMNEHVGTANVSSVESPMNDEKKVKVAFKIDKDEGMEALLESQQESEECSTCYDNLHVESKSKSTQLIEVASPCPPKVKRSPLYLSSSVEDENEE